MCKLAKDKYTNICGTVTNKNKSEVIDNKLLGKVKKFALERHINIPS
jgi:hypothetical protein